MHFADNGGCRIHYSVAGDGESVLLVPGLGGSIRQMATISAALARNHRVITIDPRGGGDSDKPDEAYRGEQLAADVVAVLDATATPAAHFVGISFGGMIGQQLALHHPRRVRSLLLASSYAASDAWTDRMWRIRRALIRDAGMQAHMGLALMFLFSPATFRSEAATVARLEAAFAATPPDPTAYLRQLDYCHAHDTRAQLGRLNVPTLVVTGAQDLIGSPAQGQELASLIPGARYQELPDVAHMFMLHQPELLVDVADAFFASLAMPGVRPPA